MDHKFKSNWETSNFIFYQKDHSSSSSSSSCSYQGYSWARRNFTCNFCNKEYKSAQALGGHMNIHRRDKAKLGLSSHHPNPNYPNPNNISPPSPAVRYLPYHSSVTFPMTKDEHQKLPLFACSRREVMRESMSMTMEEEHETRVWKKYEILNMEMEMGLIKDGNIELDLELRLGR